MEMACVAAAISCSCRARICRAGPGSGWRRRPTLRSRKAPRLRALLSEISCGWSSPGSYRTILALQWYRDSAWGQDRRAPWRHPSSCTFRDNPVAVACRAKLVRIINAVDRAQRLAPAHRLHASSHSTCSHWRRRSAPLHSLPTPRTRIAWTKSTPWRATIIPTMPMQIILPPPTRRPIKAKTAVAFLA